jgi:tetratricopeptide (TPR) repeat protein
MPNMRPSMIVLTLICLLLYTLPGLQRAEAELTIDARQQFDYADTLYNQGQYRRAGEEYQRFAFFFADDPRARTARFRAGQSFYLANDGVTAVQQLRILTDREPLDNVAVDAYFLMAESYLLLNNPNQAVLQLSNLILLHEDQAVKDRAYLRIGWIHIEQMDWAGALRALERMSATGQHRYRIERFQAALERTDQLPRKNPTLAGTLSIIPGAGQLYTGRYQDALSAFIVNAGLFWAAYESFDNDLNVLGGLLTVTGLGFYAGNIYSAVSSAHKYNQTQNERFVERLKLELVMSPGTPEAQPRHASAGGIALRVQFEF